MTEPYPKNGEDNAKTQPRADRQRPPAAKEHDPGGKNPLVSISAKLSGKVFRQRVLGHYIADFYCAKAQLVVELDGSQHYEDAGQAHDKLRTERLEEIGLTVLRVPNNEVKRNLRGVCEAIDELVRQAGAL